MLIDMVNMLIIRLHRQSASVHTGAFAGYAMMLNVCLVRYCLVICFLWYAWYASYAMACCLSHIARDLKKPKVFSELITKT